MFDGGTGEHHRQRKRRHDEAHRDEDGALYAGVRGAGLLSVTACEDRRQRRKDIEQHHEKRPPNPERTREIELELLCNVFFLIK